MQAREPIVIKRAPSSPLQSLVGTPRPTSVSLSGMYRPSFASAPLLSSGNFRSQVSQVPVFAALRPKSVGQLVTVNPKVDLTISTGLEKYMFPVGLMAGGAASFLIGSVIPESFRPVTTVIGLGLVGWGVYTLIKGGTSSPAPAAPTAPPPPASGSTSAASSPAAFQPPTVSSFNTIQVELVSPKADQTIGHGGNIFTGDTIPVTMRLFNPSSDSITFNLDFEWDESSGSSMKHGSKAFQMTLGPNEEKNENFDLPMQTSRFSVGAVSVALAIYKKRTPDENPMLISNTTFSVS